MHQGVGMITSRSAGRGLGATDALHAGSVVLTSRPLASVPFGACFTTHCAVCCSARSTRQCVRCPAVLCSRCHPYCDAPYPSAGSTLVHSAAECAAYAALGTERLLSSSSEPEPEPERGEEDEEAGVLPALLLNIRVSARGQYVAESSDSTLLRLLLRIMTGVSLVAAQKRLASTSGPLEDHLKDMPRAARSRVCATVAFALRSLGRKAALGDRRRWNKVAGAIVCNAHGIIHQWSWGGGDDGAAASAARATAAAAAAATNTPATAAQASTRKRRRKISGSSSWPATPFFTPRIAPWRPFKTALSQPRRRGSRPRFVSKTSPRAAPAAAAQLSTSTSASPAPAPALSARLALGALPVGCGIYPGGASMLNHDCDPNSQSYWSPAADSEEGDGPGYALLTVRTTRAVRAGTPLSISYVAELQPRDVRREELRGTFYFDCACRRCSGEERSGATDGAQLCGLACIRSGCSGTLDPVEISERSAMWSCAECGGERELSLSAVEGAIDALTTAQQSATQLVTTRGDCGEAHRGISKALRAARGVLHSNHALIFGAYAMLTGIASSHSMASEHCTQALHRLAALRASAGCSGLCTLASQMMKLKRFEAALYRKAQDESRLDGAGGDDEEAIAEFVGFVLQASRSSSGTHSSPATAWADAEVPRIAKAIANNVRWAKRT